MNFTDNQQKEIYEFITKYNKDDNYKKEINDLYENNTYKLSILQIYALEEVLRFGTKNIFNEFLKTIGDNSFEQAVYLYDSFINLLEDEAFKEYKMNQLKEAKETLSEMELLIFSLISKSEEKKEELHENMTDNLEYDPLCPIRYESDSQIKNTLENLFFGEFIHKLLDMPGMEPIKARQKVKGQIANIDKPFIIEKVKTVATTDESIDQLEQIINNRYAKVKMNILFGNKEHAFDEYSKYNTNISSAEILGMDKDAVRENMYEMFMDMINNQRKDGNNSHK